jgi:hypothetical protein
MGGSFVTIERRAVVFLCVVIVVILGCIWMIAEGTAQAERECAKKGGELVYPSYRSHLCVSPDGRILP